MPINGGLYYARPDNLYAGAPVEEIKALNADASSQYQDTRAAKDSLDLLYQNLDLRDVDAPIKKKAIDNIRKKFEQLVADGNYQDAGYVVSQAKKEFEGDLELQDARASRQNEIAYQQGLKKRFDEGKITPDAYRYALQKSRANNSESLKYNPETFSSENMFRGYDVLDDKSKEIYDKTFDRIKEWKTSSIPMKLSNGREIMFKTDPTGVGFAYDMQTGEKVHEDEVYQALKTEVENEYAPFLQQEREIENYKRFIDPNTGQKRELSRRDINLVDEDLKSYVSGVSRETLAALKARAARGEKGAKRAYQDAQKAYDAVNIAQLTPQQLEQVYLNRQKQSQIDKYVTPAVAKAGYTNIDHKIIEDKRAEMALAHQYKKSEIEYEKTFTAPLPTNNSQLEEFTAQDYETSLQEDKAMKLKLSEAEARLNEANKEGNPIYIENAKKEVDRLRHITEASNARQVDYVKKLAEKEPAVSIEYLAANADMIADDIARNPGKYSKALVEKVTQAVTSPFAINNGKIDSASAKEIAKLALNDPNAQALLTSSVQSVNRGELPSTIVDAVQEAKEKHKDLKVSSHTTVFGIDANSDKSWERPIIDRLSDVVKNSATNWLIGTTSLDEIVSGAAKDFYFVDEEGKGVKPDLAKSEVRPQIHHDSGQNTVRILFKDSQGRPIYRESDDKKSQAAMTFTPSDQEGISNVYRQLGESLKKSEDGNAQKQGRQLLGYTKWGAALAPIRLSVMEKGEEKPVILDTKEGTFYAKIVKGSGGFEVFYKDGDTYKPFELAYGKDAKGKDKVTNTFGSKEQFQEYMEANNY